MLITIHGVRLHDHCYTRSEAVCSLHLTDRSNTLFAIHGVKLYD